MIPRVAITGATGFIGRHLTRTLIARGVEVRAVVRPGSPHTAPEGTVAVTAPLDAEALAPVFAGVGVVVHLAGVVSAVRAEEFLAVNVDGTRAVATAARAAGARLVNVSSLAAAGPTSPAVPLREEDRPNPLTPYGASKLQGERVVEATTDLEWIGLRPGVVYGPGDRAMLPLFRLARRGILLLAGRRSAAYTFVYIDDMVRAIEAAMEASVCGETMFVGHPRPVTATEVLHTIRAVLGRRSLMVSVPAPVVRLAAHAGDLGGRLTGRPAALNRWRARELLAEGFVCSVDRLRDRLDVVASVGLAEGLARTADWYARERLL